MSICQKKLLFVKTAKIISNYWHNNEGKFSSAKSSIAVYLVTIF